MKSAGGGASHSIQLLVLGWKSPSFHAWNICRSTVTPRPADGTLGRQGRLRLARKSRPGPANGARGLCQGGAAGAADVIQRLASSLIILPLVLVVLGPLSVAGPGWRATALLHVTRRDLSSRLPADISRCFQIDVALDHRINKRAETEGLQSAGPFGSLFPSMCGMPGRVLSKQVCNLLILLNRNAEPLLFTDAVWYGQSPSRSLDIPSRLAVLSPPAATLRSPLGRLGVAL